MGLISHIKEIEQLRMTRVGGKPRRCVSAICLDGMVVIRLPGNKWWCSWTAFAGYAYLPGARKRRAATLLTCLVRLGLLKQKPMDEYLALSDKRTDAETRKYDLPYMKKLAKKYGYRITKETKRGKRDA